MEDQLDQIEKYLSGELSREEVELFEKQIGEQEALRKQVEEHRSLIKGLELGFNLEMKAQLKLEEQRLAREDVVAKRRVVQLRWPVGLAAALAVILISVYLIKTKSIDSQELFASYYQPYPNVESPVSRSETKGENAYALYEQGRYQEALDLFMQRIAESPTDPAPLFYSGICHLELNETEKALAAFQVLQTMDKNNYSRASKWYKALASLKKDDKSSTVEILTGLSEGDDNYAIRSKELLQQLTE